jgi:hypothetical protein
MREHHGVDEAEALAEAATGYEKAVRTFDQKKNALAAASDSSNRSNSQSAMMD